MIVNAGYRGKMEAALPKFTYTGQYNQREDGVVELLTSGTITFLNPAVIDIFCVGGGGGGGWNPQFRDDPSANIQYGGGGGGKTNTILKQAVNGSYQITIGNGGIRGTNGGTTSFGNLNTAEGGKGAPSTRLSSSSGGGGAGGSGGGGGTLNKSQGGEGGSDGGNGIDGYPSKPGGVGQGVTTREFGEPNGKLYAGGGGGGRSMVSQTPIVSMGGAGGGGNGGWVNQNNWRKLYRVPTAGAANTGGGGGGGYQLSQDNMTPGASGGSGIVCFRGAK